MPTTSNLELIIGNSHVDLGDLADLGYKYSYQLEEPENFMSKQGAEAQNIVLPASKNNDKVFNTFHNPQVEDLSPSDSASGILTLLPTAGGAGYAVGDVVAIDGGTTIATITITSVGGGGSIPPTGFTLTTGGSGYVAGSSHTTTAVTGVGTGAIFTVLTVGDSGLGVSFRELMPCLFNVNGTIPLLKGYALLTDCDFTEKPESYDVTIYGANGQWVIDLQNITMWDCVSKVSHTFDVATVEGSWSGFNTTEDHDFVYAPVRYRQPFDGTTLGYAGDNCVNIYHLRPSISLYWLLIRAFRQIGYTIKSQFFLTAYFQNLVLPWVWGDFYDINSQLVQGICFKAAGALPSPLEPPPAYGSTIPFWSGSTSGTTGGSAHGSSWWCTGFHGGWNGTGYVAGTVASIDHGLEYNTVIGTLQVVTVGTGYLIGDTGTINNVFGTLATYTVATVSGTGVLTVTLTFPGDATSEGYAAGKVCSTTATSGVGTGMQVLIDTNSSFHPIGTGISANFNYIFNGSGTSAGGNDLFDLSNVSPPDGFDNFSQYTFDPLTGTMIHTFNPPASLVGTMTNVSITFVIDLYVVITIGAFGNACIALECLHLKSGRNELTCISLMPDGGILTNPATHYPDASGYPITPTVSNFTIANVNPGDVMQFRLVAAVDSTSAFGGTFGVFSGGYLNNNPAVIGVPSYAYNPVTETFQFITPASIWSPLRSSLSMTGFLIQLGNSVYFQNYDAFRNFPILDALGGVIDAFNMEVQTDNIDKVVTMEPMFGSVLPTTETIDGYFSTSKILEWSKKRDYSQGKRSRMSLFNGSERQIDLTFKLDSNDGGQNIWALRYKGIHLNRRTYTGGVYSNNINIDNGIMAGVPGSARYMLPNRFAKGNKQLQNRFFSAVMHCKFPQWDNVHAGSSPRPQLICIFPEGSNSADAYQQSFSPKLAWYAGTGRSIGDTGGWIWIGDPASPYTNVSPSFTASSFPLPLMFAVNYGRAALNDPILSYSDEFTMGAQHAGLLTQFYLRRFAIMRNGQLLTANLRLNLNDVCNWTHQECIMIDGCLYALIEIDGYDPLTDTSTPCKMWKVVAPQQVDKDNCFPSTQSIVTQPLTLTNSNDIRYAQLLLYPTDLPQYS